MDSYRNPYRLCINYIVAFQWILGMLLVIFLMNIWNALISDLSLTKHWQEEFEDTKGVIRIHKSKKNKQYNGQKKKDNVT